MIVGIRKELPDIIAAMRKNAAIFQMGYKGQETGGHPVPPIHFMDEEYFKSRYEKSFPSPYMKVYQQLIKLQIFDHKRLLPDVLIVDSDTAWSRDIQFVYPNRSAVYHGWYEHGRGDHAKKCTGMDPVPFFNKMMQGPSSATNGETPCRINFCHGEDEPITQQHTGIRHVTHHMLFQRDVMAHLHSYLNDRWSTNSLWEAASDCYKLTECKSRVAEYEVYHQFAVCYHPDRVMDRLLTMSDFKNAAGECNIAEMKKCREKGVLLKGCHDHRKGQGVGRCI